MLEDLKMKELLARDLGNMDVYSTRIHLPKINGYDGYLVGRLPVQV